MSQTELDVIGIGNAIVDILAQTEDGFLSQHGMEKGSMTLIDEPTADRLYNSVSANAARCSGGSAANTMVGISSLGGGAAYVGKVRDDDLGEVFRDDVRRAGVGFDTDQAKAGPPTGRCVVMVTPDAQRTMGTFLGASATLGPVDIVEQQIARAKITYLEGYLFDPPPAKEAFVMASRIAKSHGRRVALTLSDSFCVARHRESFRELVAGHVDLLFANEDEICALYETDDVDAAIEALRPSCPLGVVTRGADGCVVVAEGDRIEVAAHPVDRVVDTTGAGDLFAAGFLAGLARGDGLEDAARLGGLAAAEVIGHFGARPECSLESWVRERA